MSDFYITLPSDSSRTEFPDNASNNFKIRLPHPIRLEGDGWKVALVSISLPDPTSQLPPLMRNEKSVLFSSQWVTENKGLTQGKEVLTADFKPTDFRPEDLATMSGKGFMKTVKAFFDKKLVEKKLLSGYQFANDDNSLKHCTVFEWEEDDLVICSDRIQLQEINTRFGKDRYPAFYINLDLALAMGWLVKNGDAYLLGPNLTIEVPGGKVPVPVDTTPPSSLGDKFWITGGNVVRLTMTCNWRFINLNSSFKNVTDSTKRSLFVYSDVGGSGVVGNQVTDLLREVNYKREGKGYQYFEPLHQQYIPFRKEELDIIEVQVSETKGELTDFGEGVTILTLHFKRT